MVTREKIDFGGLRSGPAGGRPDFERIDKLASFIFAGAGGVVSLEPF